MPHQLSRGVSVYNGNLRGHVTLTPVAERMVVELSLPLLRLRSVAAVNLTSNLPHARRTF